MHTKRVLLPAVTIGFTMLAVAMSAQTIDIRMSFKVIVDPVSGARPAGITDGVFQSAVDRANQWMASYWRGYRFRTIEIANIGGPSQGGTNGPSRWFGQVFRDTPEPWNTFQNLTRTDGRYLLRADQVNFYVSTSLADGGGGACPIPPADAGLIACQGFVNTGPWWLVHETGHFFGLSHTHGGCGCPGTGGCFLMNGRWVGDDGIADTLPEEAGDFCFTTKDQISQANFNKLFAACSPTETQLVNDTFFNIMSYHNPDTKDDVESVMTELQLDRHADTANSTRAAFVSGHTWFVDPSGWPFGFGSSGNSFGLVTQALAAANPAGGDIVLLRPGNYHETFAIGSKVTFRATRAGPATIGTP